QFMDDEHRGRPGSLAVRFAGDGAVFFIAVEPTEPAAGSTAARPGSAQGQAETEEGTSQRPAKCSGRNSARRRHEWKCEPAARGSESPCVQQAGRWFGQAGTALWRFAELEVIPPKQGLRDDGLQRCGPQRPGAKELPERGC